MMALVVTDLPEPDSYDAQDLATFEIEGQVRRSAVPCLGQLTVRLRTESAKPVEADLEITVIVYPRPSALGSICDPAPGPILGNGGVASSIWWLQDIVLQAWAPRGANRSLSPRRPFLLRWTPQVMSSVTPASPTESPESVPPRSRSATGPDSGCPVTPPRGTKSARMALKDGFPGLQPDDRTFAILQALTADTPDRYNRLPHAKAGQVR